MLDVSSRRVVGWLFASHMRTDLVLDALRMALSTRRAGVDVEHPLGLLHVVARQVALRLLDSTLRLLCLAVCPLDAGGRRVLVDEAATTSGSIWVPAHL